MRRSPVVLGIVAGLLAGAGGAAAVALAGRDTAKPKLVVTGTPSPAAGAVDALPRGAPTGGGVEIVVKGALPELRGDARAYTLGSETATGAVEKLASALGVRGPVQTDVGGWVVRQDKRLVRVQRGPGLPWFLSLFDGPCRLVPGTAGGSSPPSAGSEGGSVPPSGPNEPPTAVAEPLPPIPPGGPTDCPVEGGVVSSGVAVACPADQPCPTPTTEPPMALDPEPVALKALTAAGLGDHYAVVSNRGPSSGHVAVSPIVDGHPVSGLDWSATVSADGEIIAASGFLARPEPAASYPLIGTTAGLERLKEQTPVPMLGRPECAPEENCKVGPPIPPRTVTNVRLGLTRGISFLIPAYLFEFEGGGVQAVPAVDERYIEVPSQSVTDGKPVPASR
jgi:hypothetical protein